MALPNSSPNINDTINASIPNILTNLQYLDSKFSFNSDVQTGSRLADAASGDVSYAMAIQPRALIILAGEAITGTDPLSWGFVDESGTNYCVYRDYDTICNRSNNAIYILQAAGKSQAAAFKQYTSTGFDLTWTKTGAPTGNAISLIFYAIK